MNKTIRKLAYPYYGWLYLLAIVPIAIMLVLVFSISKGLGSAKQDLLFGTLRCFGTINP